MKVLVLGATGATGSLLVQQLINRNVETKIVVRDIKKVSQDFLNNKLLECVVVSIYEFERDKYLDLINDCYAVISCLGHSISFSGIFEKPSMLVTSCIRNICEAIEASKKNKIKVILMNTTANRNREINEKYSLVDSPQTDKSFNFRKVYCHSNRYDAIWNIARKWVILNMFSEKQYKFYDDFPFSIKPKEKISIQLLINALENHFENT